VLIYSWNVNGIRALYKKEEFNILFNSDIDIICIQETKIHIDDIPEHLKKINSYYSYFSSAKKKGYSGVAIYTKIKPISVTELDNELFDDEGRALIAHFKTKDIEFYLINCYFPNSQENRNRLNYKLDFNTFIFNKAISLKEQGHNVIICGDYNVAHQELDLTYPKANINSPGFYIEERESFDSFLQRGFLDIFRYFYPDKIAYTWWSYRSKARSRNIGWRIDYHCVDKDFIKKIKNCKIHNEILGSDHCPVSIEI